MEYLEEEELTGSKAAYIGSGPLTAHTRNQVEVSYSHCVM